MPDIVLVTTGNKTKSLSTLSLHSSKGSQRTYKMCQMVINTIEGKKKHIDDRECWGDGEEFGHVVVVTSQRVVRESLSYKVTSEQDEAEWSKSRGHPGRILSTDNSRCIDLNMEAYLSCSRQNEEQHFRKSMNEESR